MSNEVCAIKSPNSLAAFANAFTCCWFCGATAFDCRRLGRWPFDLQIHHIIKPHRSDEFCNLSRACERCHRLIEGEKVVDEKHSLPEAGIKIYFPRIELKHVLWAKRFWDFKNYDRARLEILYHRRLPHAAKKLPGYLSRELAASGNMPQTLMDMVKARQAR